MLKLMDEKIFKILLSIFKFICISVPQLHDCSFDYMVDINILVKNGCSPLLPFGVILLVFEEKKF